MHDLIKRLFLKYLSNDYLVELLDSAILDKINLKRIAFTTDSYVVSPIFFKGADIGKLAVCGTINDLVAVGARPLYISLAFIIEEGFQYSNLERIVKSIGRTIKEAGIKVVTGDLKVVPKGSCDGIFINTSGVGEILTGVRFSRDNIRYGDAVIVTGPIAEHGFCILSERKEFNLRFRIKSDCNHLEWISNLLLKFKQEIKFMRDPTRGGLATTLNEMVEDKNFGILLEEKDIPIRLNIKRLSELMGIDPLYMACEGRMVIIVDNNSSKRILNSIKKYPQGRNAKIIGSVVRDYAGKVILKTVPGGNRIVDMLSSEPLPRIC